MNVYTATATKPRTAAVAAFGVCIAATIVLTVRTLRLALAGPFVPPYQSSQYWVNYNDGFVRRGLPPATRPPATRQRLEVTCVGDL